MNQKTLIMAIAIILAAFGLIYYYGGYNYNAPAPSVSASITPNPDGSYPVSIINFAFSPAVLNIDSGDTVTWTNNDTAIHRISGGSFQSNDLAKGQTFSFKFTASGEFDYNCGIHPSMKGKIIVK